MSCCGTMEVRGSYVSHLEPTGKGNEMSNLDGFEHKASYEDGAVTNARESGMDDWGNTFLYEVIGFPLVNSKGLLKRKKGQKLTLQNINWEQKRWHEEKDITDILLVCVEFSPSAHMYFYNDIAYVCYINRTAIRLAGYPVTVVSK